MKDFADFSGLKTLPQTEISVKESFGNQGDKTTFSIELSNPSDKLAFFIEIAVLNGKEKESILPVFLDDNYISLLPGESRTIKGYYFSKNALVKKPTLRISGWNIKEIVK